MRTTTRARSRILLLLALLAISAVPSLAGATHAWGPYHWARTSNPFTLQLGDNMSSDWDTYLATASRDWSKSKVLDTTIAGGGTGAQQCRATLGRVEVCNAWSGNNGWLGLATIWIDGEHIIQGTARMNDYYFSQARFNTSAWKRLVVCQEVAHTFGLAHQDEDFANEPLGTCMDYSSDPVPNQHPNRHDFEQLEIIYDHLDSTTTVGSLASAFTNADMSTQTQWGKVIRKSADGRPSLYVRNFGAGQKVFTFVFWAP